MNNIAPNLVQYFYPPQYGAIIMSQCTTSVICIIHSNEITSEDEEYMPLLTVNSLDAEEILVELNQLSGENLQKFYLEDIDPPISPKSLKWMNVTKEHICNFLEIDLQNLQLCNVDWDSLQFYSKELNHFEFSDTE